MKYTMKNISLLTCTLMASITVLSACAQTTVSVRPVTDTEKSSVRSSASTPKHYEPISRNEVYVVQPGDTLYGISFRAGLTYRELAAWNNIPEPYTVKIGQRLVLKPANDAPDTHTDSVPASNVAVGPKPTNTKPSEPQATIKPTVAVTTSQDAPAPVPVVSPPVVKPVAPTTPAIIASEKPVPLPDIKPVESNGAIAWRWPSEGTVIARYVQGDPTQQGINIGGKSGQPVRASSDGTVVYSGAGLVGYGELIIIKHNNEWLSAYAHNRRRLVAEGTKVKAGDVIAEMGRTGTMRDMLHFEIRRNGKPVDPLLYLPKQ